MAEPHPLPWPQGHRPRPLKARGTLGGCPVQCLPLAEAPPPAPCPLLALPQRRVVAGKEVLSWGKRPSWDPPPESSDPAHQRVGSGVWSGGIREDWLEEGSRSCT